MWLSLGGFHELSETPNKIYNTHIILDEKGNIITTYRKVHMFRVNIPGGPVLDETINTIPGQVYQYFKTSKFSFPQLIFLF